MAKHEVQQRLMGMKLVSQAGNQRWTHPSVVDTVCQNKNKNVNLSPAGGNVRGSQSKNRINFATINAKML